MRIHVIGNSHVGLFSGSNKIVPTYPDEGGPLHYTADDIEYLTYRLGPVLAYNFHEKHLVNVKNILRNHANKFEDKVMLVVGEVDCRWHLLNQAAKQNRPIEEIVKECVDRFFRCHTELMNEGYSTIAWGNHPGTIQGHTVSQGGPGDAIIYGSVEGRNHCYRLFANELEARCKQQNIPFVSILEQMIDERGSTKMKYLYDYCHLDTARCFPMAHPLIKGFY